MPKERPRIETGVIQFEEDWPGVFIRGDNAMNFAGALRAGLSNPAHPFSKITLESLLKLLESSYSGNNPTIQKIERK